MAKTDEEMAKCLSQAPKIKKLLMAQDKVKRKASKLKLLAHPTRLQIIKLLSERDLCVCVLSKVLSKKQPNISQHLAKLRDNSIIEDYNIGKLVYYRITDKSIIRLLEV